MCDKDYSILPAVEADREEILSLYRVQVGREFCAWTDDYPGNETIDFDLARDALFVMKRNGRIVAAISIDEDPDVGSLPCWDQSLVPGGELARLCVLPGVQNQGLARIMLKYALDELKKRGYRSVRFLVNCHNVKAIRSYASFGFSEVGKCHMFEQDFLCYEQAL